jgi:hypothetical protein
MKMKQKVMQKLYMKLGKRNGEQMNRNLLKFFAIEGSLFLVNSFLSNSSFISNAQLKAVFEAYGHFSKKDIEAAIKSETSGNLCRALLAIGKCKVRSISDILYGRFKLELSYILIFF